jgi:hypothetical protein
MTDLAVLRALDRARNRYGAGAASRKLALLSALDGVKLRTAAQVGRLHEVLCFWRAYPDDAEVLGAVERALARFANRPDARRLRDALVSSGIAGSDIVYPFGRLTASWLAARWGNRLRIEWQDVKDEDRLTRMLVLFALAAEVPGLDEAPLPPRPWLDRLRGTIPTDAGFLARRAAAFAASDLVRDRLYDELQLPCRLAAGPHTPNRTHARFRPSPVVFHPEPLRRTRPDLRAEALRPPEAIRPVGALNAARLIDLARGAMVTRQRDLDGIVWADERDVRLVECGGGLQFACIGALPERRFLLESVYAFLTLKNGVPIGYALASGLLGFSEIAYNVFETFRAGEAAHVYGRLLATARALFASDVFMVPPYQLGDGNEEGVSSGAWWFYRKLGFRPRAREAVALEQKEAARLARNPSYLTPVETLERLVKHPLYLSLARGPAGRGQALRLDRIGFAVTDFVAARFGADRERASEVLASEAASWLRVDDWRRLPPGPRGAWKRWAPLVAVLRQTGRWTVAERQALARVVLAKGGRRESDFVTLFDAHARLRAAIGAISRGSRWTTPGRRSGADPLTPWRQGLIAVASPRRP